MVNLGVAELVSGRPSSSRRRRPTGRPTGGARFGVPDAENGWLIGSSGLVRGNFKRAEAYTSERFRGWVRAVSEVPKRAREAPSLPPSRFQHAVALSFQRHDPTKRHLVRHRRNVEARRLYHQRCRRDKGRHGRTLQAVKLVRCEVNDRRYLWQTAG